MLATSALRSSGLITRQAPSVYGRLSTVTRGERLRKRSIQHDARELAKQPPVAFVFDIDGVLVHGPQPLDAAKRALAILDGANPLGTKIPYLLLTNGGGVGEEIRRKRLAKQLEYDLSPNQYIQSHTVLKSAVDKYADEHVLVLGGKFADCRYVAESYGFKNAYTTLDVHAWNPAVWPFHELSSMERESTKAVDFAQTPISAIFVFHDPRNWALDIQIVCDVIQGGGIIGRRPSNQDKQSQDAAEQKSVELVFCNPDLLWRSDFERPRIGQGAFREAFQAVFKALTGAEYPYTQYGKPTRATYKFAEQMLRDHLQELYGPVRELPQIYMVGDNPESDIAGANAAGWSSILVHTGVYDPRQGPPMHQPTQEVEDVEEAVRWAIEREMKQRSA
ncbi:HAD-superfamily hydrolase [Obba rivulosa]|uniref:HAD-superfamily hydrolase n=1 Tax=Obba rivulosa TaxID=1052685 RepID=A0A8E2AQE6_9APHY|nr:HAD-superfamily hydrolase [Obba rivulosa]